VRPAAAEDFAPAGRLLYDFNREYDEPTPGPELFTARLRELVAAGDTAVLVAGAGPDGLAVLRFRPSLYSSALECYLAELYVVPALRGRGLGRALLDAAIALAGERGADHMDLGTSEDDIAARALYESAGFTNRERPPDGPVMFVYERAL
jgi:ribosomal protein S18 acetylase RimI-like enzyme